MGNDKLLLSLFALGVLSLLGLAFYFFGYSGNDTIDNAATTTHKTNQTQQQPLSTFTPPPIRQDEVSDTPTIVEYQNENESDEFSEANEVIVDDGLWKNERAESTQTPAEFIQHYFRDLKSIPYEQTWAMQSANFQAQNTLEKHAKWWSKKVDSVEVDKIIAVDGQKVTVRLRYQMQNGRKVCSIDTFSVIKSTQGWLIDGQKYRNCR